MKRLLYIAYYFPPAGGPGVQRSLKFVRYLPDHGWLPTVVTVHPDHAAWPAVDPSMVREIPADVEVHRTRAWDPYAAYAGMRGKRRQDAIGVGFDPAHVTATRHGVAESIVGRMRRHGGSAEVISTPGAGTEVRLRLPLEPT